MSTILMVVLGVVIIEGITFFGRCVLKKTGAKIRPTLEYKGKRIGLHHGITGALLIAIYGVSQLPSNVLFYGLLIGGLALLISDVIHHGLLELIYGEWDPSEPNPLKKRSS